MLGAQHSQSHCSPLWELVPGPGTCPSHLTFGGLGCASEDEAALAGSWWGGGGCVTTWSTCPDVFLELGQDRRCSPRWELRCRPLENVNLCTDVLCGRTGGLLPSHFSWISDFLLFFISAVGSVESRRNQVFIFRSCQSSQPKANTITSAARWPLRSKDKIFSK